MIIEDEDEVVGDRGGVEESKEEEHQGGGNDEPQEAADNAEGNPAAKGDGENESSSPDTDTEEEGSTTTEAENEIDDPPVMGGDDADSRGAEENPTLWGRVWGYRRHGMAGTMIGSVMLKSWGVLDNPYFNFGHLQGIVQIAAYCQHFVDQQDIKTRVIKVEKKIDSANTQSKKRYKKMKELHKNTTTLVETHFQESQQLQTETKELVENRFVETKELHKETNKAVEETSKSVAETKALVSALVDHFGITLPAMTK